MIIKRYTNKTYYVLKEKRYIKIAEIAERYYNGENVKVIDSKTGELITLEVLRKVRLGKMANLPKIKGTIFSGKNYYPIKWTGKYSYIVNIGNNISYNPRKGTYTTTKIIKGDVICRTFGSLTGVMAFKTECYENYQVTDEKGYKK